MPMKPQHRRWLTDALVMFGMSLVLAQVLRQGRAPVSQPDRARLRAMEMASTTEPTVAPRPPLPKMPPAPGLPPGEAVIFPTALRDPGFSFAAPEGTGRTFHRSSNGRVIIWESGTGAGNVWYGGTYNGTSSLSEGDK